MSRGVGRSGRALRTLHVQEMTAFMNGVLQKVVCTFMRKIPRGKRTRGTGQKGRKEMGQKRLCLACTVLSLGKRKAIIRFTFGASSYLRQTCFGFSMEVSSRMGAERFYIDVTAIRKHFTLLISSQTSNPFIFHLFQLSTSSHSEDALQVNGENHHGEIISYHIIITNE